LHPEAQIADAVELLLKERISCIPIVDREFKPVGILSWRDVLKSLHAGKH
jgi:acetoin utilization protein AcuB